MKQKPLVFVGSSSEKSEVAEVIVRQLRDVADAISWKESDSFKPTSSTLDGLLHAAQKYHFGIFVLTPDDKTKSRGTTQFSPRDNVLFEFGLFLGALGPKRTWALMEKRDERLKVPSDLLGIHIESFSYTSDDNLASQISAVLFPIKKSIKELGRKPPFSLLGPFGLDDAGYFFFQITPDKLMDHREKIGDQKLLLVVRKHDTAISPDDDTAITKSDIRSVSRNENEIELRAAIEREPGVRLNAHLFLVPEDADVGRCKNMKALEEKGCLLLNSVGVTP
jgi:hypothetical protein